MGPLTLEQISYPKDVVRNLKSFPNTAIIDVNLMDYVTNIYLLGSKKGCLLVLNMVAKLDPK